MRPAQEQMDISRDLVSLLPRMRRFALTLTRDGQGADDLVQAVCERAAGRQPVWNGHGRLEDALYMLARTLRDEAAARHRAATDTGSSLPGSTREAVHAGAVQQMILAMPEGLASVFLLVAVEKHTYREASHILALPLDTVAGNLASTRAQLAAMATDLSERRA